MPAARAAALKHVDDLLERREIASFEDWQRLVQHADDPGFRGQEGDGAEFEGE